MSDYNTKNYTEQGGERTVIGGELVMCLSTEKCSECAPKSVAVDQHPMR